MNEEFAEVLLELAQQSIATSDVLCIICQHLAKQNPQDAAETAQLLENVCAAMDVVKTPAFLALAGNVSRALRNDQDMKLPSAQKTNVESHQALLTLMKRLRGS